MTDSEEMMRNAERHGITINGDTYQILEDPWTGDWVVWSDDDGLVQDDWMNSKNDAIEYVLDRSGIVEEGYYERAPTRCDA